MSPIRLLAIVVAVISTTITRAEDRPNILLILADDLGYHDVGFHGAELIKTPNLDWLASNGVRFTDGHVSASVCSPTRAGLMTGRYQQRFGHEANVPPAGKGMDVDERTLGQALRNCGYRTAIFGKWHLGNTPQFYPTGRGFDEFWGLREGHRTYWFDPKHNHDKPGDPHNIEHNGKSVAFEGHVTDRLGDRTIEFIESDSSKPFFIFLSFTAPHSPLQSKPEDMEALGTKDHYAGLVYGLDRNVGRILKSLEQKQLLDNTLIWFLSDNGGIVRQASNEPLAGRKGLKLEGGHRVPFVMYWKNHVNAGQVYDQMVSALDIYPTSVTAAGGSLDQPKPLDGVNLLPYLKSGTDGVPHPQLYWRKLECAAMRDGSWKLIRIDGLPDHLFNLDDNIAELPNLAGERPDQLQKMQEMLRAWESDKMQPLWKEGAVWTKVRLEEHTKWFSRPEDDSKKRPATNASE